MTFRTASTLFTVAACTLLPPDRAFAAAQAAQTAGAGSAAGTGVSGSAAQAAGGTIAHSSSMLSWGGYFQALAILFLLVAILWGALWYLKNKAGLKILSAQGDLAMESRLSLGPKKTLVVVRFLNKRLLLGVTDHQITMLTELPTDEEHDDTFPAPSGPAEHFDARLRAAAGNDAPTA